MPVILTQENPLRGIMRRNFWKLDHFENYTDAAFWTKFTGGGGAPTVAVPANPLNGLLTLTTGTTQYAYAGIATTNKLFKFVSTKSLYIEAGIQYTEANTNTASIAFGCADDFGSTTIGNAGATPTIGNSGALIYKTTGTTVWATQVQVAGGTPTTTVSPQTAGASTYFRLGINIRTVDNGTNLEATFSLSADTGYTGPLMITGDTNYRPITTRIALASATAMKFGLFLMNNKSGGLTETLNLDYFWMDWVL